MNRRGHRRAAGYGAAYIGRSAHAIFRRTSLPPYLGRAIWAAVSEPPYLGRRSRLLDQSRIGQDGARLRVVFLQLLCEGGGGPEIARPVVLVEIGLPLGCGRGFLESLFPVRDLGGRESLSAHDAAPRAGNELHALLAPRRPVPEDFGQTLR